MTAVTDQIVLPISQREWVKAKEAWDLIVNNQSLLQAIAKNNKLSHSIETVRNIVFNVSDSSNLLNIDASLNNLSINEFSSIMDEIETESKHFEQDVNNKDIGSNLHKFSEAEQLFLDKSVTLFFNFI